MVTLKEDNMATASTAPDIVRTEAGNSRPPKFTSCRELAIQSQYNVAIIGMAFENTHFTRGKRKKERTRSRLL